MQILPAIDLKNGKCVRLTQGVEHDETIYADDPVAVAQRFVDEGAPQIHLVDLDGAFRGESANQVQIQRIAQAVSVPLELGGGIRTVDDIRRVLDLGIRYAIIGTMAVKAPEVFETALQEFGDALILGLDAKAGRVAVSGWVEVTELSDEDFANTWKARGVQRVIYTDIARDGMLTGPNLTDLERMARNTGLRVTASGGVSSLDDLRDLRNLAPVGVDQVIVGKAIYEQKFTVREAGEVLAGR